MSTTSMAIFSNPLFAIYSVKNARNVSIFVTRMLTRDLFAVAKLLIDFYIPGHLGFQAVKKCCLGQLNCQVTSWSK